MAFEVPFQLSPKQRTGGFSNTTQVIAWVIRTEPGRGPRGWLSSSSSRDCPVSAFQEAVLTVQPTGHAKDASSWESAFSPAATAPGCLSLAAAGHMPAFGCLNRSDLPTPEARWPQGVTGADKIQAAK